MTTATIPSRMADFDLTPEQQAVRRAVREFAEREILPFVEEHETAERYPATLIEKLIPLGYLTPIIPERYGGSETDVVTYGVICEELARVDWVVASVVSVTNSLVAGSIVRFGTDAQKEKWLPAICDGSVLTSACLTEPGGGSDLAGIQTRAVKTEGGWRLDGSKVFISHAAHAGVLLVAATIDPAQRHRGVTVFLVDPTVAGVEIAEVPMRTLKRDNLALSILTELKLKILPFLAKSVAGFRYWARRWTWGDFLLRHGVSARLSELSISRSLMRPNARPSGSASGNFK